MRERIEVNPNVHLLKPWVAGMRIPVRDVLELVGDGIPFEAIVGDYYPTFNVEDVRARVRYAVEVIEAEELHVAAMGG